MYIDKRLGIYVDGYEIYMGVYMNNIYIYWVIYIYISIYEFNIYIYIYIYLWVVYNIFACTHAWTIINGGPMERTSNDSLLVF